MIDVAETIKSCREMMTQKELGDSFALGLVDGKWFAGVGYKNKPTPEVVTEGETVEGVVSELHKLLYFREAQ